MKKITFLDLAEKVLLEVQKPLSAGEIWAIAVQKGWDKLVKTQAIAPKDGLYIQLYEDEKKLNSRFELVSNRPKKFILKGMANDDEITKLHEEIYLFLQQQREQNPDFYFLLRDSDAHSRLSKGYWFWGNNDYLVISFWKRKDTKKDYRNIALYIEKDGTSTLRFSATDDEQKAKILKTIASFIPNMKAAKEEGQEMAVWEKRYETTDYITNIQDFIENRKPAIDAILALSQAEMLASFEPVNADSFTKNIDRIEALRKPVIETDKEFVFQAIEDPHLSLKKLTIENIGIFSHLEIDFSEKVTVLIGENGIGKTTILRALALALAGVNENSLLDTHHPKIENLLHIQGEKDRHIHYAEKGAIGLDYYFENKLCKNGILLRSDLYGVKIEDDLNSDFTSVTNDKFPHLVIGFSQSQNAETPLNVKQISPERLAKIKEPHIKDLLPLLYNQADDRFNAFVDWIVKLYNSGNQVLLNTAALTKAPQHILIEAVFSTISDIIGYNIFFKTVSLSTGKASEDVIWIQNGSDIENISPINLVSQGFNSIFSWVGYLMMRMYESSKNYGNEEISLENIFSSHTIVLIDEIDTYLHPKWQRKILKVLVKKFPKTQFVVTTHSPLVATHLDENAKVYSITQDRATPIQIAGRDISSALWDYFGVERREMLFQGKIDALFALFEQEPLPVAKIQADLVELKAILGEKDPDIEMAERMLEGLLWIEKED